MSLFGTLERSANSNALQISSQLLLPFLFPALQSARSRPLVKPRRYHRLRPTLQRHSDANITPRRTETLVIQALVRASTCQKHAVHTLSVPSQSLFGLSHNKTEQNGKNPRGGVHKYGVDVADSQLEPRWSPDLHAYDQSKGRVVKQHPKEELLGMVAMYEGANPPSTGSDSWTSLQLPSTSLPAPMGAPGLNAPKPDAWDPLEPAHEAIESSVSWIPEVERRAAKSMDFLDNIVKDQVPDSVLHNLWHFRRLLEDKSTPNHALFDAYRLLPAPRAPFLNDLNLRSFLNRLSWNKEVTEPVMLRFLSVLDDMKTANIEILSREWNSAIHFAGRFTGKFEASDVQLAMQMWKEMEQEAGVQSDHVSFTILFDMASKAKRFALADMILKEMERRKLHFSRTTRMSLIFYHGLRGNGDGVRREYANMVAAGEIIDTMVLTNVIVSLIHAGEPSTAEYTFERMKSLHAENAGLTLPPHGWRANRTLHKVLTKAADRWRDNPEARLRIQSAAPLAPNVTTYRVLIEYHAIDMGNLDRTFSLIEEMEQAGMLPDGKIFFWVFAAFGNHGGVRYSSWNWPRLEQVMAQFFTACEERPNEVELDHGTAVMAVRAFFQCANIERTREIWDEIKSRWTPSERTVSDVTRLLLKRREQDFV